MAYYLIRHGETEWNHSKKIQGWKDVDLNDLGLFQAEMLAKYYQHTHVDFIYASDLKRAYKTAHIFSEITHKDIIKEPLLREIDFGAWEGYTWKEILVQYKDFFDQGGINDFDSAIHGGESLLSFKKRAYSHFLSLVSQHKDQDVFIFTHGGNIRMILNELLNQPMRTDEPLAIDNASVSIIEWNQEKNDLEVILINDTRHLKGDS